MDLQPRGRSALAAVAWALAGAALAAHLQPVLGVVGAHNCPYNCNNHGLCDMADFETRLCKCYPQWAGTPLCDRSQWAWPRAPCPCGTHPTALCSRCALFCTVRQVAPE